MISKNLLSRRVGVAASPPLAKLINSKQVYFSGSSTTRVDGLRGGNILDDIRPVGLPTDHHGGRQDHQDIQGGRHRLRGDASRQLETGYTEEEEVLNNNKVF